MLEALADHDSAAALCLLEESSGAGVQPGDLLTGLIDFVRDAMVLATGEYRCCWRSLRGIGRSYEYRRAMVAGLDPGRVTDPVGVSRWMRGSSHGRLLVELAIVRVARLEDLTALGTLVERLAGLESGPMPPRKPDAGEAGRQRSSPEAFHGAAEPTPRPAESPAKGPGLRAAPSGRTEGEGRRASESSPNEQPAPAADGTTKSERRRASETSPNEQPAADGTTKSERRRASETSPNEQPHWRPAERPRAEGAEPANRPRTSSRPAADGTTKSERRRASESSPNEQPAPRGQRCRARRTGCGSTARHGPDSDCDSGLAINAGTSACRPAIAVDTRTGRTIFRRRLTLRWLAKPGRNSSRSVPELGLRLSQIEPIALEGPDVLVIAAKAGYNSAFDDCGTPEALAKIGQTLGRLVHRPVRVKYERLYRGGKGAVDSRQDARRADSVASDPMVQRLVELFEARTLQLDYDDQEPAPAD